MLWLLLRTETAKSEGPEANGFVVRAESEERARQLADAQRWAEPEGTWISSETACCWPLALDAEEGVILASLQR